MIRHHSGAVRESFDGEPVDCQRILFCGEDNPQSSDPVHALYPYPPNCAGERLCNKILRLDEQRYMACWRTNLCHDGPWDRKKALARVEVLTAPERPWGTVVLLGAKVKQTWMRATGQTGEPGPFTSEVCCPGIRVIYLPHPSGRNQVYNTQAMRDLAKSAVAGYHPSLFF